MNEDLKTAKQEFKDNGRPYQTYSYYLGVPIATIVLMGLAMLGLNTNSSLGLLLFIFTVVAHVGASKLTKISKRKYVAPILIYIANIISIILIPILFKDLSAGGSGDTYFSYVGLFFLPLEIIAIIFFFISAHDIKKAYPTMKQDFQTARSKYLEIKRGK
ncbi:hypothetical protein [Lapidilactobacillus wuchangensis]|uniref:hypothetical protein n=1 Tax=Lapidilactobacillus wuchangensis TaxID=2486001 RepID=UPI000F779795|nr:hypothetical protein [Lapidilactobacillus wuchangensis]